MFENEIAINEFLIRQLEIIAKDIPDDDLFPPSVGHGHSPIWILGHLAISGEMGHRLLGGSIAHPEWLRLFGPGSAGTVSSDVQLTKQGLVSTIIETYERFRELALAADAKVATTPHSVNLFTGTSIKTVAHCITHLLTSHFSFHLAQLSSCRRVAGYGAIF